MEKWDRILSVNHVLLDMKAKSSVAAIRELAGLLSEEDAIQDHKRFVADIIRREKQSSTEIGNGVAVPHTHEDSIRRQILAIGISADGVEFDAVDGGLVHIVALLATPKKHHKQHMELLAALSRLLQHQENRQHLREAKDSGAVLEVFTASR